MTSEITNILALRVTRLGLCAKFNGLRKRSPNNNLRWFKQRFNAEKTILKYTDYLYTPQKSFFKTEAQKHRNVCKKLW